MKKIIITILCLVTVITAIILSGKLVRPEEQEQTTSGAEEMTQNEDETTEAVGDVKLPFFKGKHINPFLTDSPTNLSLSTLLYDSLFIMNDDWSSSPLIAKEFQNNGKEVTVKLVDGICFSNGNSLTAYDVVYSFKLAKESSAFKGRLANFSKATAGSDTVTFTLTKPDIYAQQCLTFPIVQNGSGTANLPIGSGRYVLRNNKGQYILTANQNNTRNETLTTKIISLVPITAEEDEIYRVQTGALSYYYNDMSTGEFTKLTASTVPIKTNNLIYIGCNGTNSFFKDKNAVTALRLAIDKGSLADTVFDNFCTITETPFNPDWFSLKDVSQTAYEYNIIKAGNLLDELGYSYAPGDKSYRYDADGYLTFKIIVNKENPTKINCAKFIGKALINLGINVSLEALEFDDYVKALKNGDFDLYIGEVRISPNMDLSCFFSTNGSASYGITSNTIKNAYSDFRAGSIDINTFLGVFEEEAPFIPVCYRTSIAYYSNEVTFDGTVNEYEPFKNINTWKTAKITIN